MPLMVILIGLGVFTIGPGGTLIVATSIVVGWLILAALLNFKPFPDEVEVVSRQDSDRDWLEWRTAARAERYTSRANGMRPKHRR